VDLTDLQPRSIAGLTLEILRCLARIRLLTNSLMIVLKKKKMMMMMMEQTVALQSIVTWPCEISKNRLITALSSHYALFTYLPVDQLSKFDDDVYNVGFADRHKLFCRTVPQQSAHNKKPFKNRLRSTMRDDWFTLLTILVCERDVVEILNIEDVVDLDVPRCPVL